MRIEVEGNSYQLFGVIKPTDVKIYYEDGVPYLEYKGVIHENGRKILVSIPKMGLELTNITKEVDDYSIDSYDECGKRIQTCSVVVRQNFYTSHDGIIIRLEYPKRKMTQKEIEDTLGYAIDIISEDER